jgi:hypothetical protein
MADGRWQMADRSVTKVPRAHGGEQKKIRQESARAAKVG